MQRRRKVLFVGDGGNPEILKRLLNDRHIDLEINVKPASLKMLVLLRHVHYFQLAVFAVFSRRKHDSVFIWQQYVGLYYFLLSIVYPFHQRPCCVYYIIYRDSPGSIISWIKRFLMTRMIRSRFVQRAVFLSRCDALYPHIPSAKRILLSTYTEKSSYIEKRLMDGSVKIDSDYFSGGANNRDFLALKHLAESMEEKEFTVACLPRDKARMSPIPKNMRIDCEAYGDAFEELVLTTRAVVLPLEDPNVTSGQIVCLRALQSAKPVFMTKNNFIIDWMPDIASLRFLVMYETLDDLRSLLIGFSDSELQELGLQAREYYLNHFDEETFYRGIVNIIDTQLEG